jgi:hypothetical protein
MKEARELAVSAVNDALENFSQSTRQICSMLCKEDAIGKVIIPEVMDVTGISLIAAGVTPAINQAYAGERRDLEMLFGVNTWKDALKTAKLGIKRGQRHVVRAGDYVRMPLKVSEVEIDGVEFGEIDIDSTELTVVHVTDENIFINFEDVIQFAAMNAKSTNAGGFKATTMAKYLNGHFFKESGLSDLADILVDTDDGFKITLLSKNEIFGDGGESDGYNWTDLCNVPFDYFQRYKNRIKVFEDDTKWYWLKDPSASNSTYFVYVGSTGGVGTGNASYTDGGVSPAFCI